MPLCSLEVIIDTTNLVRMKSTKNYKYIFWFLFDIAIVNTFILYSCVPAVGKKMTLKDFRAELAKKMIGNYNSRKYYGRPSAQALQSSIAKKMKLPHYPTIELPRADAVIVAALTAGPQLGTLVNANSGYATRESLPRIAF